MRKLLLTLLSVVLCTIVSNAQNITGNVKDEQGKTLTGATVVLKKVKDSSVAKLSVTNAEGQFSFAGINAGTYFINVTFVGHIPKNSSSFEFSGAGDVTAPELVLSKATGNLKEVVVAARKPMVEVRADKTIVNVENSVNAVGQDALELLRKSPGVTVDKDDNLSLSGKNGVQVYIDGRATPLSGKDLADYLKSIQSSNVESIELISNPSAKYDAAGNAGIINIKLKKNKAFGTNGSITAGYNIGVYPKYNGGFSLNHRNERINVFGNYNYNDAKNESPINLYRKQPDTLFDQKSRIEFFNKSHNFKAGLDYFINRKNTIGIMVNGTIADQDINNDSRAIISHVPTNSVSKILVANNTSDIKRDNGNFNLNYRYADTTGRELNMDADYGLYRIRNDQYQPNLYYDPSETTVTGRNIYRMISPTDIDIYTFKADYEQNFKKGRLGLGAKVAFVKSDNDFQRYNVFNPPAKSLDTARSNKFVYDENVNAAYVNYNKQYKGFMVQLGLRVENTHAKGHSTGLKYGFGGWEPYDSTFDRNYTDFFPSAAVTLNKNPAKQWTLSYSRRIDRPAYQDLNPFEFKLDEYSFMKGNTDLRPQYTNSVGLTFLYKYTLNVTLNYSHISDVFGSPVDTVEKSKSFITKKNLATQDITSINISYPFQYKWYSIFANLNANYSKYKADFGGKDRKIDLDAFAFTFFAQQTFRLGKGWTGEMSGLYISPSIWQGAFKSSEMWSIDGGLMKTVMKGKGTVKASVSDIFRTMRWRGTSSFAGQDLVAHGRWESRQLKLNFTYRFGSAQVKAARQRNTSQEEESKRVSTQGGGIGQ